MVKARAGSPPLASGSAGACGAAVRRRDDGSIDIEFYRRAAARARAESYDRLLWAPLRRLLSL
jgi:hypothetical protein